MIQQALSITLPYPPSVNSIWRQIVIGNRPRTILSRRGRDYYASLPKFDDQAVDGDVHVTVDVYPPDRRRRDLDNVLKVVLDSITKMGAIHDDSQIKRIQAAMHDPLPTARIDISIEPMTREGRLF